MKNTDYRERLLRSIMVRKGMSKEDIAKYMGVSARTILYKITDVESMKIREAQGFVSCLNMTDQEILAVFFDRGVTQEGDQCESRS